MTDESEGRWIFMPPRRAKEPSRIYSLRLPVSAIDQLRVVAAARGEAPTALLRDWILEQLDGGLKELGEGKSPSTARGRRSSRRRTARGQSSN